MRAEGTLAVVVAVQWSVLGSYLPPVFKKKPPEFIPPQMIISLPVQIAVCSIRAEGTLAIPVAVQVSVLGSYLPPVFRRPNSPSPPQMIIWVPVQTAV
jgi:hypothetical protein